MYCIISNLLFYPNLGPQSFSFPSLHIRPFFSGPTLRVVAGDGAHFRMNSLQLIAKLLASGSSRLYEENQI